jgi:hypothetical protein
MNHQYDAISELNYHLLHLKLVDYCIIYYQLAIICTVILGQKSPKTFGYMYKKIKSKFSL